MLPYLARHTSFKRCRSAKFALHCAPFLSLSLSLTHCHSRRIDSNSDRTFVDWRQTHTEAHSGKTDNVSLDVYLPKVTKCPALLSLSAPVNSRGLALDVRWPLSLLAICANFQIYLLCLLAFGDEEHNFQNYLTCRLDWSSPSAAYCWCVPSARSTAGLLDQPSALAVSGHRSCKPRDGTALSWHVPVICIEGTQRAPKPPWT